MLSLFKNTPLALSTIAEPVNDNEIFEALLQLSGILNVVSPYVVPVPLSLPDVTDASVTGITDLVTVHAGLVGFIGIA
jgi:hypothetical protein